MMTSYSDWNGTTVEIAGIIQPMSNETFALRFPGVTGYRYDSRAKQVGSAAGSNELLPVTRKVNYKANPSRHDCDDRCKFARGKHMNCECACGGKNHGKGK